MMRYLVIKRDGDSFEKYFNIKLQGYNCDILSYYTFYSRRSSGIKKRIECLRNMARLNKKGLFNKYDKIIIFDEFELCIWLLLFVEKEKLVLWLWNILDSKGIKKMRVLKLLCNVIWTFDENDANKYGLKLNTQFFFMEKEQPIEKGNGVFFVGRDKGRYNLLRQIKQICISSNIDYIILIKKEFSNSYDVEDEDILTDDFIEYDQVLELIKSSDVILDIVKDGQRGLTMRSLEAVSENKRIITNNPFIKSAKFYNPHAVLIIDSLNMENIKNFLNLDFSGYKKEDAVYYDCSNWLLRFWEE
jgi:hypothetical protein